MATRHPILTTALKLAAATLIVSATLIIAPSFASEPTAFAMSYNPDAPLDTSNIDSPTPPTPQINNFPGGLSLTMQNGMILTCRDFETIPTQECNSSNTIQHYLHTTGATK